jgi:glycosyltransferase involved in cell wall biosynthesis
MKDKLSKMQPNEASASTDTRDQTARRLRILVVAPSFDILGGQAVQAARLVSRLRELPFFEVGFLPINPRLPGPLRNLQAVKYLRTILTTALYIATLLVRVPNYDVIHVFSASYFSFILAPTPAILIAKLFGKKVLLNYHSGEAEDHLNNWRSAVATIRLVDEVTVPSQYLVRVFEQFGIQARAINNLIELDQFTFRERSPLRAVFLSNRNLETHYGVDHVLRAFAMIQAQFPEAELVVAGEGSQRSATETLARDLGLRHARFVGRVEHDEIVGLYHSADVYLNGSEIDNQPLSILEAFACGLPVVTTDAGGIPDMVADGVTGFVVGSRDHKAIADRAVRLLEEPGLAGSISQRASAECEKYSWEVVRPQWIQLYNELVNHSTRPSRSFEHSMGKLWMMSLDELRVRSSQAVAAFAERWGWSSLTRVPSDRSLLRLLRPVRFGGKRIKSTHALLEHFRARSEPGFFAAFEEQENIVGELRSRWPTAEKQIIDEAERIVAGRFDLLGLRDLNFGDPINWSLEPVSGKSAPSLHWSRLDYLDADIIGDKKIVWELNRHQYFVKLGQAYWLTNDEKYAETFIAHLDSWMDQNSPKVGINWASSLEIAFRSISWLWAFYFFRNSPKLNSATFNRALKFLYLNARHLETYLSTYFSPNTHLTGEALGLLYLGTLLPEFREAGRWRATGRKILVEQLARQVKPDGVYFEQSSYYHRYTTDFYTHMILLSRATQERLSSQVEDKLKALLDHLMYITRPDGITPFFGDDDGGRLMVLDRRPANDFRAALSTGAALFERSDYKFVAGELAEETLWLLGTEGARAFDRTKLQEPAEQSMAFPDGGYYVMRDGWHRKANYLLFDCGPHGADNCGHAHADALAIEVTTHGQPSLIDSGTYTYTGSKELRDRFRGSSAHNVLMVDGEPSSLPAGPFSWTTTAKCEPLSWINERRFDYVAGRHYGYQRLSQPATITRSILFLKNDYWLMRDGMTSAGSHQLDLRFHFASGSNPQLEPGLKSTEGKRKPINGGDRMVVEEAQEAGLQVIAFGPNGQWGREDGWVSNSYGEKAPAPVCIFSAKSEGSEELITLLLPYRSRAGTRFDVSEVEAIGGRAFEISSEDHCDLVLLRDARGSKQVETVRLVSDFNWTWARFSRVGDNVPDELLVLDGQRLELDGKEILKSAKAISYLLASRIGDRFRLETAEGVSDLSLPARDLESLFEHAEWASVI